MANKSKFESFIFRETWWQNAKAMQPQQRAEIYDAICRYVFEGIEPEFDPMSAVSMAVRFICTDIETDKAKYAEICEKRAEAGRRHRGNQYTFASGTNGTNVPIAVASGTNGTNGTDNDNDNEHDNDNELLNMSNKKEKQKDKSFSFSQKKEKIIFDFSLLLLSEGRPNAYAEAVQHYEYNESFGWTTKTTKPNGDIVEKEVKDRLSYLTNSARKNESCFAPRDGAVMAAILRRTGMLPENAAIMNDFRGFMQTGDDVVAFRYSRRTSFTKFANAIGNNEAVNIAVFEELLKVFPNTKSINFTTN